MLCIHVICFMFMNRSIFCSVLKHIAHLTAEMVFIVLISYRRKSSCQKALCVFHCCCCSITAVIDMIYLPQTNNELSLLFSSSKLPANISAKSDWFYQSYSGNDILCHLIVFDCVYCELLLSWWLMRWWEDFECVCVCQAPSPYISSGHLPCLYMRSTNIRCHTIHGNNTWCDQHDVCVCVCCVIKMCYLSAFNWGETR